MSFIYPKYYTRREGGNWHTWPKCLRPNLTLTELEVAIKYFKLQSDYARGINRVIIAENLVHSLAFDDPAKGIGNFPRWDCINGWTTPLPDSK